MAQYVRPEFGQALASGSFAGSFGRYARVQPVTAGWFNTGSNAGGAAIIRGSGATGNMTASLGGNIDIADLSANHVFEIEPGSINVTAGTVYVLYGHAR